jgi:hypothetical protein
MVVPVVIVEKKKVGQRMKRPAREREKLLRA